MTTTNEEWQTHEPIWAETVNDKDFPGQRDLVGCTCGQKPGDEDGGMWWFGEHLTKLGGPDYMQTYWQTWATHVEAPADENARRDAAARELFDYWFVMEQVSVVYSELADLSKPNYYAHAILGEINRRQEEHYREHYAGLLCDEADGVENDGVRAVLLQMAEEWSPGSVDEHRRHREMVARLQKDKAPV